MSKTIPEFTKDSVYALVDRATDLIEVISTLKAARTEQLAQAAKIWDETVAPVKATLDAMPAALAVKAKADAQYAKDAVPVWGLWETAVAKAKDRWKKQRGKVNHEVDTNDDTED